MRIRKSTQIALGAIVLGAAAYFGYRFISGRILGDTHFSELQPGNVNIVGIELSNGYAIRVENQVAQLVEAKESAFHGNESDGEGPTEGSNAKRIPIKDMLGAMQGDQDALGHLVMIMNDRGENDSWPPIRVLWKSADLKKALDGDPALQVKLESDLNMKLDGTPLTKLRISSYHNGIIVQSDVPVNVLVNGQTKTLYGHIQTPYRPALMSAVDRQLENKSDITQAMIIGYYGEEAEKILQGKVKKEDVRAALKYLIEPRSLEPLAEKPSKVLNSAKIILNEKFIDKARYTETGGGGKSTSYDLQLSLNDEGRRRLWAYSRDRVNLQLLLISNGVAIAAPRIRHELWTSELTITQMHDKSLLDDMIASLQSSRSH